MFVGILQTMTRLGLSMLLVVLAAPCQAVDFAHDVVPILRAHCVKCHGGEKAEGGFSLNSRALILESQAVIAGDAAKSRLIELVTSADPDDQMPPQDQKRLTAKQITVLRGWIDEGLKWEPGFSFAADRYEAPLQLQPVKLPPGNEDRNPVDRIIDHYFLQQGLKPPAPLDDAAFARRMCLDVIGLAPTTDELNFETRQQLIDQVLSNDRAYAEHWMTFWNDLLRNAYSGTGYIDDGRRQITGWLYGALLRNKPYDEFVRELIAPTPESEGFIRGIKWRGRTNASQTREIQFAQSISQAFLGINMKCASCHDSFIDHWTLEEAYNLAAIYSQQPLELHRCDLPTGQMARPQWIYPELGSIDEQADQPQRLRQLADLMTHPDNGRLTRTIVNRIWCQLMGRGIVHPVDAMQNPPWNAELLDYLAHYLIEHDYDLRQLIRLIVSSDAYQSRSRIAAELSSSAAYQFRGPHMKRITVEQMLDVVATATGNWPQADPKAYKLDGRKQGGQLAAVLAQEGQTEWGERPLRASLTPLDALQASLGRPNREQIVTSRSDQLTTLEAINLANGEPLARILDAGAAKLLENYSEDPRPAEAIVDRVFLVMLSRPPTAAETRQSRLIVGASPSQEGVADLLWSVLMLPEFQFIR